MKPKKEVIIYTDGACSGNPGPGGYGAILIYGSHEMEISGAEHATTNNRMEVYAIIAALERLKGPCIVQAYSDSQYLVNSVEKGWVKNWRAKEWKRKGETVPNRDLWEKLLELLEIHEVKFNWVRGHSDNEYNCRCDKLATDAIKNLLSAV